MLNIKITAATLVTLMSLGGISSNAFAAVEAPSAEQIKLEKDRIRYKAYIPKDYSLFEAIQGDLNKDGQKDLLLMVKATDPENVIQHEYRGELDRNRRGLIVLLNHQGKYTQLMSNLDCFSSENEEGGVYYAPELSISIQKGILNIDYAHGRYGYWSYAFRLSGNDLALIGYDQSNNHGPYIDSQTSINFLTQRKLVRINTNRDYEQNPEPRFKEIWSSIKQPMLYLSQIEDFDELDFSEL
ncbi:hypothetical protein EC844_10656 [Acinetobacter calcoaceticus]|uniref:Uncharacterized protein n=1 Tax=Acinetobacter calcoaceticus TaxID=471 RepID=A0A4R1XUC6_ACICA|nr:hypothetical protein EC844_10656 [Acinetobacter calcoaceticus]